MDQKQLKKEKNGAKSKNLNDCFGIKIMLQDDKAIKQAIASLQEAGYNIRSIKDHKKIPNTNYNAVHVVSEFRDSTIPFEIQLRTEKRAKGRVPHDLYKMFGHKKEFTYSDKMKVTEDFIRLARMKMNGEYRKLMEELPICYRISEEEGKKIVKKIPQKEVLRNLYPTVEEILGTERFIILLDKLFPKGVQERRDLISEDDKKILNIFFDFMIQRNEKESNMYRLDL